MFTENLNYSGLFMLNDMEMARRTGNLVPMWKTPEESTDLEGSTPLTHQVYFACTQCEEANNEDLFQSKSDLFTKDHHVRHDCLCPQKPSSHSSENHVLEL